MKGKPKLVVEKIADAIREWPCVDSILAGPLISGEFYDPYYFLSLDVYISGPLPDVGERKKSLEFGLAFESSQSKGKDRLFVDEIPVRIEYKTLGHINDLIDGKEGFLATMRDSGTFVFYRIIAADILYARSDWIEKTREKLAAMPQPFWDTLRSSFQSRMERFLSDLGAAAMRDDDLFFHISFANFLQSFCSVLFVINRRFEPSFRLFTEDVRALPVLPESFAGRFDSLVRSGSDFSRSRKYEIAQLLVRSILSL